MNKLSHFFFVLLSVSLVFSSCKKDDDEEQEENTQYVNFSLNNVAYGLKISLNFNENTYYQGRKEVEISGFQGSLLSLSTGSLTFEGVKIDSISYPFTFSATGSGVGVDPEFSFVDTDGMYYTTSYYVSDSTIPDMEITLTGFSENVIRGTFKGTAYDNDGIAYDLTNGTFKSRLTLKP